jgi:hypothetical protein
MPERLPPLHHRPEAEKTGRVTLLRVPFRAARGPGAPASRQREIDLAARRAAVLERPAPLAREHLDGQAIGADLGPGHHEQHRFPRRRCMHADGAQGATPPRRARARRPRRRGLAVGHSAALGERFEGFESRSFAAGLLEAFALVELLFALAFGALPFARLAAACLSR